MVKEIKRVLYECSVCGNTFYEKEYAQKCEKECNHKKSPEYLVEKIDKVKGLVVETLSDVNEKTNSIASQNVLITMFTILSFIVSCVSLGFVIYLVAHNG